MKSRKTLEWIDGLYIKGLDKIHNRGGRHTRIEEKKLAGKRIYEKKNRDLGITYTHQ